MKNICKSILAFIVALTSVIVACEKPVDIPDLNPEATPETFIARFLDGTGEFRAETSGPYQNGEVVNIIVPWYFPEESFNETDISRMRVFATLPHSVIIDPPLQVLDLTRENPITVTLPNGSTINLTVKGERRRSDKSAVERITIQDLATETSISGIVNEEARTISFVAFGDLSQAQISELSLSPHAEASVSVGDVLDLNANYELTVTADNGVSQTTYTLVKEAPGKLPKGIRPGSARILFERRLSADLGINVTNLTGGIAAIGNHVVLNTRNENSVYINAFTGQRVGEVNLGSIRGGLTNFYNTADASGNILVSNLAPNSGNTFNIWKISSVSSTPETFIQWDAAGLGLGRKFSVQGSINADAIITAPIGVGGDNRFARWTVVDGTLTSQTPEIVTISGYNWTSANVDIVPTSATNVNSDYYIVGYSNNRLARVSGTNNTVVAQLDVIDQNFIANAVDYIEFNNGKYVSYNHVNSFSWGQADQAWLIDAEGDFSGNPAAGTSPAVIWSPEKGKYGPNAIGAAVNGNGTGDVALRVSDDGYYLYLYFMFTNGYIVGVQFDCIDL